LNALHADGSAPEGYTTRDGHIFGSNGKEIGGVTRYNGILKRSSDVFLSKSSFVSKDVLFMAIQHEYVHVGLNYAGFSNNVHAQEVAAYNVTINQARQWGYNISDLVAMRNWHQSFLTIYSPNFQVHSNIKIIKPW
jgi:hypothetical protein